MEEDDQNAGRQVTLSTVALDVAGAAATACLFSNSPPLHSLVVNALPTGALTDNCSSLNGEERVPEGVCVCVFRPLCLHTFLREHV